MHCQAHAPPSPSGGHISGRGLEAAFRAPQGRYLPYPARPLRQRSRVRPLAFQAGEQKKRVPSGAGFVTGRPVTELAAVSSDSWDCVRSPCPARVPLGASPRAGSAHKKWPGIIYASRPSLLCSYIPLFRVVACVRSPCSFIDTRLLRHIMPEGRPRADTSLPPTRTPLCAARASAARLCCFGGTICRSCAGFIFSIYLFTLCTSLLFFSRNCPT